MKFFKGKTYNGINSRLNFEVCELVSSVSGASLSHNIMPVSSSTFKTTIQAQKFLICNALPVRARGLQRFSTGSTFFIRILQYFQQRPGMINTLKMSTGPLLLQMEAFGHTASVAMLARFIFDGR
jgi:hypothetical protein